MTKGKIWGSINALPHLSNMIELVLNKHKFIAIKLQDKKISHSHVFLVQQTATSQTHNKSDYKQRNITNLMLYSPE